MRQAEVIGMTTTGAARYWHVLQQIQPNVIIVEEAAEVLESHIVTTLSPGCEHLILIGDHKQLRPSPAVYDLAKRYNLDISLFERMVNNGMQCKTLEIQHRMRPEIASMVRPIYPDLKNHDSVTQYENIKGVGKNMYFIDHNEEEALHEDNQSRSNEHEARYLAGLCKYFLLQGYSPEQITVLTTYSGQLLEIRKFMPKSEFEGVRVCVVDNYQGEENDIILLSLVRSNKHNSIGFLKTDNRVCVALSRAKKGFYIIGNLTLLANQADLWSEILQILRKQNSVGPFLELYCNNHPDKKIQARTSEDFKKAPEGGCLEPCEFRLECGHVCVRICHIIDSDHKKYQCPKPCSKHCEKSGHPCLKKCSQECGKCEVMVEKNCPKCSFTHSVPCHFEFKVDDIDYDEYKCKQPCSKTLCNKGHVCPESCCEECDIKCSYMLEKGCTKCKCTKLVPCYFEFKLDDPDYDTYKCNAPCPKTLCDKEHVCPEKCYKECDTKCSFMVEKDCPKCKSTQLVPCYFQFKEDDPEYEKYKCNLQCTRILCEKEHLCPQKCYEKCRKCVIIVQKEHPKCHHINSVPCCFNFEDSRHVRLFKYKCKQVCQKSCPKCDFSKEVPCYFDFTNDADVAYEKYKCKQPCSKKLCELGHLCPYECWKKCAKKCSYLVEKENPFCHHEYEVPCSFTFSGKPWTKHSTFESRSYKYNKCQILVDKKNPVCLHIYKVPCFFVFSKHVSRYSARLHSLSNEDENYDICQEPCAKKLCDNDHLCPKKCYEECGRCMFIMEKKIQNATI